MDLLILETQRLLLPLFTADEVTALVEGCRLPHWVPEFPRDDDRDIARVLARTVLPDGVDTDLAPRLVVERESGLVVGSAGFHGPPENGRLEIGYGLVASRRGRGYATEAVRALTAFALGHPAVTEVVAGVEPGNLSSIRVLEKAGYTERPGSGTELRYGIPSSGPAGGYL